MKLVKTQNKDNHIDIKSILLIDDCDIDNFISSRLIKKIHGAAEAICKTSAEEGLQYLQLGIEGKVEIPEIIFLDIRMPSMDGFEFLREFAKLNPNVKSKCSIFMLSSSIDQRDIERAKKNPHVVDFITKPLSMDKLNNALSAWKKQQSQSYQQSA